MNAMKFTKGPWSAYQGEDTNWWWIVRDAEGHELGSGDGGFEVVDAHLMAAAPDLYEACKKLLYWADTIAPTPELANDRKMAIAVLAKARGAGYDP